MIWATPPTVYIQMGYFGWVASLHCGWFPPSLTSCIVWRETLHRSVVIPTSLFERAALFTVQAKTEDRNRCSFTRRKALQFSFRTQRSSVLMVLTLSKQKIPEHFVGRWVWTRGLNGYSAYNGTKGRLLGCIHNCFDMFRNHCMREKLVWLLALLLLNVDRDK